MSRLFKACFTLVMFVAFYFIGCAGAGLIHNGVAQSEPVSENSLELLANWHSQQFPDATPWETCEQEIE